MMKVINIFFYKLKKKNILLNLFVLTIILLFTSKSSFALGFKLDCKFNNLNMNESHSSKLKDFFSNSQKHKFIGRDVNIIGSKLNVNNTKKNYKFFHFNNGYISWMYKYQLGNGRILLETFKNNR